MSIAAKLKDTQRLLAEAEKEIWCLNEELKAADARIAELEAMVKNAYNAGFIEGMKEHTHSQGGIPWRDSKFRAALESK